MTTDRYANWALVVVDVQQGFDDASWGPRNNPDCDTNIAALVDAWTDRERPLVFIRHDSTEDGSPLDAGRVGNDFKPYIAQTTPDLLVSKSVNSAFHGTPDLHAWLLDRGTEGIVVCGITTNHCCETTARVGGNLGHEVHFALDATHTFDRVGPDGTTMTGDELARATATNLHDEFATVLATADILAARG